MTRINLIGLLTKKRITWKKNDAKMALISARSFEMGDHLNEMGNASPMHRVDLDTFYMDVNVGDSRSVQTVCEREWI